MDYTKHQQGDVILNKISEEDFNIQMKGKYKLNVFARKCIDTLAKVALDHRHPSGEPMVSETRAVLQEGEATGHAHAIYMNDLLEEAGVTLYKTNDWDRRIVAIEVKDKPVELKHEEHDTITLEPGYYLQRIVNEYDHISGQVRRVADLCI